FYLGNGGYYFAISDYLDLALTGTIYSRGSWGFNVGTHYAKRYRYTGNTVIRFVQERFIDEETAEISKRNLFSFNSTFARDVKSNPNYRFNTNINFQTSGFNRRYAYDPSRRLNNQFGSSVSYQRIFRNKPFNFTTSANHTQNTQTGQVTIGLPEATFGVSPVYPFKRKEAIGKQRWYEKIGISYTANAKNYISGIDTLLFNSDDMNVIANNLSRASNYGARHTVPINTNLNVLKHFTVTPQVAFNQWFYGKTIRYSWNEDSSRIERDTVGGFATAYEYNAGVSAQTRLYGMYQFKRGKVQALRHVFNPSVNFNYRPDFANEFYNAYELVQFDTSGRVEPYSRYAAGIYGGPGSGRQGAIGFNLGNNLEMKVASRKDTLTGVKKVKLLDRFDFGSSYNLAADSLKWQRITMRLNTTLLNRISVNVNADWDPYTVDPVTLRRVNKLELEENNRLARLTNAQVALGGNFAFGQKTAAPASLKGSPDEWEMLLKHPDYFVDFNVPLNLNVNYILNIRREIIESGDTTTFNQSINLRLDMNLTKNWKVNVTTNYDVVNKEFSSTFIEVFRDLHCWQMRFGWVPIGPYQSYNFDLRVKSSLLQDLKISRRKGWNDIGY
ncbi:MAG TPA: putative LPS assembly protein LptD, partial [Chitinophagales bacterium]|nr:putative LPS assembly protein LptD [Chitinophagales bacterium]